VPSEADLAADADLDSVVKQIQAAQQQGGTGGGTTTPTATPPHDVPTLPAGLAVLNDRLVNLQGQTVYTFDGDPAAVDTVTWPVATGPDGSPLVFDGKQLYTYAGDTADSPIGGVAVDPAWHLVSPPAGA
jgi:predicted lipoprotein with Yx(FWY)xxD motif